MKNYLALMTGLVLLAAMSCVSDTKTGSETPSTTKSEVTVPKQSAEEEAATPAATTPAITPVTQTPANKNQPAQVQQAVEKPVNKSKPVNSKAQQGQMMTGKDLSPQMMEKVMARTGLSKALLSEMGPQEIERAMEEYRKKMDREADSKRAAASKQKQSSNENKLPSTCGLVTTEFIGKTIGVPAAPIDVKDGSAKNVNYQRACFFKWPYNNVPNSGIMVQLMSNPLPDELPDWASAFISSKKNAGDKAPDGSATYQYKDFAEMGIAGAYNYELGRYYWRTDKDHVVGVLFNLQATDAEQLLWARKIGKEVMKNLY